MKNYYINPLSIRLSIQYSRYICRTNYTQVKNISKYPISRPHTM